MRVHTALGRLGLLLPLLAACPGEAPGNRDARTDAGSADRTQTASSELGRLLPDLPPNLCAPFTREGESCAVTACPSGLIPAILDGKSCTCHVPCNPDQGKRCQPEACGRICIQLSDAGKPLPGQGACLQDQGALAGDPCVPTCQVDLTCMAQAEASFCRQLCTGAGDCLGYKMVCVPLSGADRVCIPGGSTTGPKLGESCAAAEAHCVQSLLCDPQSHVCLRPCDPAAPCPAPATCTRLVDPASGVVIGHGCK